MVKNLITMRRPRFEPQVGKNPGEGNGNPLQYSFLENSTDRVAWCAPVHGVAKSRTQLSDLTHTKQFLHSLPQEVKEDKETYFRLWAI